MEEKGEKKEGKKEEEGEGAPFRGIIISAEKGGLFQVQTPGVDSKFEVYGILIRVLKVIRRDLGDTGE